MNGQMQTVIHNTADGRWMPCQGGLVRVDARDQPTQDGLPLAEYPGDSLDWEVVPFDGDGEDEGVYEVWRCTSQGEVSVKAICETEAEAEAIADHLSAGPDGVAVGSKFAVYLVVQR